MDKEADGALQNLDTASAAIGFAIGFALSWWLNVLLTGAAGSGICA